MNNSNTPFWSPSAMIAPDADVILAIHKLRKDMATTTQVVCRHLYGHQDSSRSRLWRPVSPSNDADNETTPQHSLEARVNIACDRLATETSDACLACNDFDHMPPSLEPHYVGSLCCFKIGSRWITSNVHGKILLAQQTRSTWEYCKNKYGWDQLTMGSIHWEAMQKARKGITKTKFMLTSKLMHGWLPIMHMHGPGCEGDDETLAHLFVCPHPRLTDSKVKAFRQFRLKCSKLNLPMTFFWGLSSYVEHVYLGADPPDAPLLHTSSGPPPGLYRWRNVLTRFCI